MPSQSVFVTCNYEGKFMASPKGLLPQTKNEVDNNGGGCGGEQSGEATSQLPSGNNPCSSGKIPTAVPFDAS